MNRPGISAYLSADVARQLEDLRCQLEGADPHCAGDIFHKVNDLCCALDQALEDYDLWATDQGHALPSLEARGAHGALAHPRMLFLKADEVSDALHALAVAARRKASMK